MQPQWTWHWARRLWPLGRVRLGEAGSRLWALIQRSSTPKHKRAELSSLSALVCHLVHWPGRTPSQINYLGLCWDRHEAIEMGWLKFYRLEASVRKRVRRTREEPKRVERKMLGSLSRKLGRKVYGVRNRTVQTNYFVSRHRAWVICAMTENVWHSQTCRSTTSLITDRASQMSRLK